MNISDEWETPEKQPFKDFVCLFYFSNTVFYSWIQVGSVGFFSLATLWSFTPIYVYKCSTNSECLSVQGNMRHWIEDPDCRDQYSVIYEAGERTAIFNNDAKDPITAEERAVSNGSHFGGGGW